MKALAVKYRPKEFEEVVGQKSVIKILKRQLELKEFLNCYLFCGASGTGKTTTARIFANKINNNKGEPIEIDGASNNGVENVKNIIKSASERAVDSEYKIYIIDECHALTNQAWQAFLKCIEEPPKYTIFLFCTTDPQKIPATILNRVQRFNLTRINQSDIKDRLIYVCKEEGFTNYEESCDYISKISNGGMRDALAYLDKVSGYSDDLSMNNVLEALGNYSYDTFFKLTNALVDGVEKEIINIVDDFFNSGKDLKIFVDQYLDFVLDMSKYCIFNDMSITKLPLSLEQSVKYCTGFEGNKSYFNRLIDKVLEIKNLIKYDSTPKTTILIMLLQYTRGK